MTTQSSQAPWLIECEPGKGVIARYATDDAERIITPTLSKMHADGADGISLSPWLMQGAVANGAGDAFLDWNPATGRLVPEMEDNLIELLGDIRTLGFNWVQIAPQFYSPDPRKVGMDAFQPCWLFIAWLHQQLQSMRMPFLIDACTEFNDVYPTNAPFAEYVRAMWDNVTATSAPNGIPCWDYTMSFIPGPNLSCLSSAFQGNWPAILMPHCYSNEPTLADALQAVWNAVPTWSQWIIGETDTLQPGDEPIAQQLVDFVTATKQRIMRVCPWPVTPRTGAGVQLDVFPPIAGQPWKDAGC